MGMIGKYKIIFDTADAANSDNIGAYLRASDGTLLTHTDNGGKKSLDVNVTSAITTTSTSVYAEDTAHTTGDDGEFILTRRADTPSSSAGADGDYAAFNTDANGRLYVNIHDGGNTITVDGTVELGATTLAALETITVTATDLDIRDLTHVSDSVKIGDGTDFLAVAADGSIAVTDNGASLTVDAVNLDIRDLTSASDSVAAVQSGTWNIGTVTTVTTVAAVTSITNPVAIIADHANDSMKVGDGTDFWAIDTTGYGRVADYFTTAANAAVSIDTTAGGTALVASALSNRSELWVQNNGNKDIYVGVGTVTSANGLRLVPGSLISARVGNALSLKAIADSGTQDVRTLEFA